MEKGLKQFMIDYFTDQIHLKTSREKGFEEVEAYNHAINKIERSNQAVFHKYAAVVIETLRETPFFRQYVVTPHL